MKNLETSTVNKILLPHIALGERVGGNLRLKHVKKHWSLRPAYKEQLFSIEIFRIKTGKLFKHCFLKVIESTYLMRRVLQKPQSVIGRTFIHQLIHKFSSSVNSKLYNNGLEREVKG